MSKARIFVIVAEVSKGFKSHTVQTRKGVASAWRHTENRPSPSSRSFQRIRSVRNESSQVARDASRRDAGRRHASMPQPRFVPRVRRTTKNLTVGQVSRDTKWHFDHHRSNSIRSDPIGFVSRRLSQIAGSILITIRLSFDRLFIGDRRERFHRSSLRFYDLRASRYLISPVSRIVTGVDPDTPSSTNCGTAPVSFVRPSACRKQIDWPSATRLRDEIFYVLVARGGVTRTTRRRRRRRRGK